jgi:hypothetical protein
VLPVCGDHLARTAPGAGEPEKGSARLRRADLRPQERRTENGSRQRQASPRRPPTPRDIGIRDRVLPDRISPSRLAAAGHSIGICDLPRMWGDIRAALHSSTSPQSCTVIAHPERAGRPCRSARQSREETVSRFSKHLSEVLDVVSIVWTFLLCRGSAEGVIHLSQLLGDVRRIQGIASTGRSGGADVEHPADRRLICAHCRRTCYPKRPLRS